MQVARLIPSRTIPELKEAIPAWLENWTFSRFITLAFNDSAAGDARIAGSQLKYDYLKERLRKWDAHVNHALLGRQWATRHSDRTFSFFVPEKSDVNPHWHGLIRFYTEDAAELRRQETVFDGTAEGLWRKLVPAGTVDIQVIDNQLGVAKYLAKTLPYALSYESYIVPDQLRNG